ncbi:hypothetical protein [Vibrio paucivorans]|uniref:3-demethylubiquinone-9 3-methyltransferase n=1 Tax=Vibrio paucivorans TaxID=2829489 RepID=A0A9X3HPX8_9VIBR|nr:hypothetical protein [Vibrio paucivorans]MCW8332923.1 hypothetical protein [Vibrio paucivorans]
MESLISQLKKDFYARLNLLQRNALPHTKPTLSFLTEEELRELETVWVELSVWKVNQKH